MPTFNDLPRPVREKIYRLHLTYDEIIDDTKHEEVVKLRFWTTQDPRLSDKYYMPPLLTLSGKIEKEAAPYYYSDNHFVSRYTYSYLLGFTWPRHLRLVRRLTVDWTNNDATERFKRIGRLRGLVELRIGVDEKQLLRRVLQRRVGHNRVDWDDPTPQQQLAILQSPGMAGLLALCGKFPNIESVEFVKKQGCAGKEAGGPISGGILETQIAPRLRALKSEGQASRSNQKGFDFLSLSPELRNQIYDLLLHLPGSVQLSTRPPTSASKKLKGNAVPDSVLSLLVVNRQIHDEAVGIFYHHNSFTFHYVLHLHSFLLSLGHQRLSSIRNLTIHYSDFVSGGMSLTELTLAQFKRLKSLRSLEIFLHGHLVNKITWSRAVRSIRSANPARLPGLSGLFNLRGLNSTVIRDVDLELHFKQIQGIAGFPHFPANSFSSCVVQLEKALRHFNDALLQAQKGNVVRAILDDDLWQTKDEFPALEAATR